MNKEELVAAVAKKAGLSKKDAEGALKAAIEAIKDALKKGSKVTLTGFGTFLSAKRAARKGVNPQTGASINIPARTVPRFKAGKGLKDAVK
ncbi:MAG: HU family DNA-binding protein [Candidatus Moranbacteria bacterium]|jgi:DNA-binding protein HU-beta|nr:HU family DNA-binding protein [Candidatus Moranbacteria bacterium]